MAQAHSPQDDRHWIGQARRQAASGQHKAALQSYQRVLPRSPTVLLSRLAVLQAATILQQAADAAPKDTWILGNLAAVRLETALAAPLPMQQRAWMLRELGAARERLGEPDAAFSAFVGFNHLSW